ncbi:ANKMY2 [Symbiodinium sp. CCMP2592]|nr:ANKMY2 [Symbiodinium sp. CCMP2592]
MFRLCISFCACTMITGMEKTPWDVMLRIIQLAEDGMMWRRLPQVYSEVDFRVLLDALVPKAERNNFAVSVTAGSSAEDDHDKGVALFNSLGIGGLVIESNPAAFQALRKRLSAMNESGRIFAKLRASPYESPDRLLQLHSVPKDFDALTLSTGSFDLNVLRGTLGSGYRPKLVLLEVNLDVPPPFEFEASPSTRSQGECMQAEGRFGVSLGRAWSELWQSYSFLALESTGAPCSCRGKAWFANNKLLGGSGPLVSWQGMVRMFWEQITERRCMHMQRPCPSVDIRGLLERVGGLDMERWNHAEMSLYVAQLPWHPVVRKYIEDHEEALQLKCPGLDMSLRARQPDYASKSSLPMFLSKVRREGLANPFRAASCFSRCIRVSEELWNDTMDFRGHQWRTQDISDELEHAWIRHFGPYRQKIHQVFGCRVPIFVNWYALLHRDITNSDPYNRAWGTVGLTMLYNPECSFVTLSVLDRGPNPPQGGKVDSMPNLLVFGSSHGHIPIPLVRKASRPTLLLPPRYYVTCLGRSGFARSVVLDALRTDAFRSALAATNPAWPWENLVFTGLAPGGPAGFERMAAESKFCVVTARFGRSAFMLAEVVQVGGCLPVYVWDDVEWAALTGVNNLTSFGFSLRVTQLWKLPLLLRNVTSRKYSRMKRKMARARAAYTMPGTMAAIRSFMQGRPALRYQPLPPERVAAHERLFKCLCGNHSKCGP